jgi:hypothetical protein
MAADRDDEPGVLGNLPRSRPGRRSAKRGGTGAGGAKKAPAKSAGPKRATRASTAAKPRQPAAKPRGTPTPQARAPQRASDPVGQAVQLAGKVAAIGVRTVADVVKRIPRP